jgi:hypothetical protein
MNYCTLDKLNCHLKLTYVFLRHVSINLGIKIFLIK